MAHQVIRASRFRRGRADPAAAREFTPPRAAAPPVARRPGPRAAHRPRTSRRHLSHRHL